MSKFIFPLQMSATDGKYHNYFGEFSEESFDAIKRALLSENSTSKKVECKQRGIQNWIPLRLFKT